MKLYKLLGVAKSASKQEIRQAYRKLALQLHPDKHTQSPKQVREAAAEKFKEMSAAYETLVDDCKRAAYDRICDASETHHHHYGTTNSEDTWSWSRRLLRIALVIIVWIVEEAWHSSGCEVQRDKLREKHEGELEELRKRHERDDELRVTHDRQLEKLRTRHERERNEQRERHEHEREERWRRRRDSQKQTQ